jgi:hypothetical protein
VDSDSGHRRGFEVPPLFQTQRAVELHPSRSHCTSAAAFGIWVAFPGIQSRPAMSSSVDAEKGLYREVHRRLVQTGEWDRHVHSCRVNVSQGGLTSFFAI